jgi:hypothetical protein
MQGSWSRWKEIRRGALAVIAATQRSEGLWFLSTAPVSDLFTPVSSPERNARMAQHFGTASITVTWLALKALEEIFGEPPEAERNRAIHALEDHCRSTASGAYGTWKEGWRDARRVFESPRHSAMALIMLMQFDSWIRPQPSMEHCRSTALWLLSEMDPSGGWREEGDVDGSTRDFSTAVVIAALSLFLQHFAPALHDSDCTKEISEAVDKSFKTIDISTRDNLWTGLSVNTQLADCAFIIEMLMIARSCNTLATVTKTINIGLTRLVDRQLETGWGENSFSKVVSTASTTCVLSLLCGEQSLELLDEHRQTKIGESIAQLCEVIYSDRSYWRAMTAWDWISLARLSNTIYTRANSGVRQIEPFFSDKIFELRQLAESGELTREKVRRLSIVAEWPLLYVFSYGHPDSVPSGTISRRYYALPGWVQTLVIAIPGAVVGVAADRICTVVWKFLSQIGPLGRI